MKLGTYFTQARKKFTRALLARLYIFPSLVKFSDADAADALLMYPRGRRGAEGADNHYMHIYQDM